MKNLATSLDEYAAKRDFSRSLEPRPARPGPQGKQPLFVIQKHAARHLHYDFRLEMDGVLKSWAVPKGLPMTRGEKRLAMRVEDHPLDYARFEGIIAEGNYGAGTVMVWDIGTYEVSGDDPVKAFAEGKLHLTLHGEKLNGEWALVKMRRPAEAGKEAWLIFKAGKDAPEISARRDDESALTHRSMKRIAEDKDAQWGSGRPAANSPKPAPVQRDFPELKDLPPADLSFVIPMNCRLTDHLPKGGNWIYEIKFDGIRGVTLKDGDHIRIYSRLGNDVTGRFPEVVDGLRKLPCKRAVLDGEIVALEESGRSSFQLLQASRMPGHRKPPICYYIFDLLNLEGRDLKNLPLYRRKELLQNLLEGHEEVVRFSASLHADPNQLLEEVRKRGLEGLIAKKEDSLYEPGHRSGAWLKIKVLNSQEFVIGGYTQPKGSRPCFGAILVGYYQEGELLFASKVGTGFNEQMLRSLRTQFDEITQSECPFANLPEKRSTTGGITASEMKKCTWVQPKLVCEVRFTEWTNDNHLRQPVFAGLRDDKRPEEVVRETPS